MNVNSQIMPYAHSTRCSRLILLFISRQSQIQTTYNHLFFHFEHCLYFYFLKTVPLSVNLHVLDLFIVPQPKKSFSFPQSPKGNLFHDWYFCDHKTTVCKSITACFCGTTVVQESHKITGVYSLHLNRN